jgi:hypothetical protein
LLRQTSSTAEPDIFPRLGLNRSRPLAHVAGDERDALTVCSLRGKNVVRHTGGKWLLRCDCRIVASSLDGYIAPEDGGVDWIFMDQNYGMSAFLQVGGCGGNGPWNLRQEKYFDASLAKQA